jgi:hypothetical protein
VRAGCLRAECISALAVVLDLALIRDYDDRSGNGHSTGLHNAVIDGRGAEFDGDDDYITVSGLIQYASDARFSISFWMTKEACTGNTYEYMYSHQEDSRADAMLRENSNVNIYLACESADSGWSTSGGSVVRFLLRDDSNSGRFARFDYPLHEAGNFDDITNRWVHIVLGVNPGQIKTFVDGQTVTDSDDIHYYADDVGAIDNIAYPDPRALTSPLTGFSLEDDLYLGSRSDGAADRHFVGRLAGVVVGSDQFAAAEAACLFSVGERMLPPPAGCSEQGHRELPVASVSFIDRLIDTSHSDLRVRRHGHATAQFNGAVFSGAGDYITIANPQSGQYAEDGEFTVSFWFTKQVCTGGIYEYMFSHQHDISETWDARSFVNVFLGCEEAGGGWSSAGGSIIRFNLRDETSHEASFDYPLHDAGDFDAITRVWVHVILSGQTTGFTTYIDGSRVEDSIYHYFSLSDSTSNTALNHPSRLTPPMTRYQLLTDIYLGSRADLDTDRHFVGRIALLNLYDQHLEREHAECLLAAGEHVLPAASSIYRASGTLSKPH